MPKITCKKCGRTMEEGQYYKLKTGGFTDLCKKCLTMHIDAFDKSTFLWALEKLDLPYVECEWNVTRDKDWNTKGELKFKSDAVFGKYLAKMKLKQFKDYGWADSEALTKKIEDEKIAKLEELAEKDEFLRQRYEAGEITEAEYRTYTTTASQRAADIVALRESTSKREALIGKNNPYDETKFFSEDGLPNLEGNLTKDDKVYLAMKWGRLYQPNEWIILEKDYSDMMSSFDIQDADSKNTLILLCKTNLKAHQALDGGDIEGFQKLSKVSESLRKTAKFTAAQNKDGRGDYVDSIGELVRLCEKQGFIPRYATNIPKDKVDLTLRDMREYLHKLVTQDLGFGQQIEDSLKKIMIQKELNEEANKQNAETPVLLDEDYQAFYEEQEKARRLDNADDEEDEEE